MGRIEANLYSMSVLMQTPEQLVELTSAAMRTPQEWQTSFQSKVIIKAALVVVNF